jgi:ammonia channel protein AmtB
MCRLQSGKLFGSSTRVELSVNFQMHPWASILVGVGSGTVYMLLAALAVKFKIDDPLDAFAVHFGGGAWGLMIAPILIDNGLLQAIIAIGSDNPDKPTVAHASMVGRRKAFSLRSLRLFD